MWRTKPSHQSSPIPSLPVTMERSFLWRSLDFSQYWRIQSEVMNIDTRLALLQAFTHGESYGLEIIERVKKLTSGHVRIVQGRVYPALRELEAQGLLESYDGPPLPERNGRPRRYYKITAAGERAARQDARAILGLLKASLGMA